MGGTGQDGTRRRRWWGLLTFAGRRVLARASRTESRQVALNVFGIALPVALMLVVTSVSIGLTAATTVQNPDIDYWIVPESGSASSAVVSVQGPQLGRVHDASDRINAIEGVTYATPVLLELVQVHTDAGAEEYALAVGVVPRDTPDEIAGVSTDGLAPGDPYYANGSYDGAWTGQAVISEAAADLLGASAGTTLDLADSATARENQTFSVVGVSSGGTAMGDLPVVLVHLSELQTVIGATATDRADQFLVKTTRASVQDDLGAVYPRSLVLSRSGLVTSQLFNSELPLAVSATALVVAVMVGALFAASTMGLAIAADSHTRAVLAAIGFSGRSRSVVVAAQALLVAFAGGVLGVVIGAAGALLVNAAVARYVIDLPLARFHPALVAYGLGVALLIGLLTVPYLLVISRRTTTMEAIQH